MRRIVFLLIFIYVAQLTAQVLEEDFETGDLSAYAWELSGDAEWFVTDSYSFEGDYSAEGGNVDDNQSTGLGLELEFPHSGILAFAWKVSSEANYDFLRFYLDEELVAEISGVVPWTQQGYELTAGVHTLRWSYEKDYSVSNGSDIGWLDDLQFYTEEEEYNYDLEMVSLDCPQYMVGVNVYSCEAVVRNNGQFNMTGYTVSLVDSGGEEYASETVYWMLAPGAENTVELEIDLMGDVLDTLVSVYALGYLQTDENPGNNYSSRHDIHFTDSQSRFARVGMDSTFSSLLPCNFTRRASVYECLYYAEELGESGVISSIDFFNNFANGIEDIQINLWLAETDLETLESGWVSAEGMQMVYSGSCDFAAGENIISIRLDNIFEYEGGNLVLLMEKGYDPEQHSWQSNFYYSEMPEANRARFSYSDTGAFDPTELSEGVLCNWVANTAFTISPVPWGDLEGFVYDAESYPLAAAQVTIDDSLWITHSLFNGWFGISQILTGTHVLEISKPGYEPYIQEIEIIAEELLEIEVYLEPETGTGEDELLTRPLIGGVYPNPFRPGSSRSQAELELNLGTNQLPAELFIYDVKGRRIDSMEIRSNEGIFWDGRAGEQAACTGIYFLRILTRDGQQGTTRLLLIK